MVYPLSWFAVASGEHRAPQEPFRPVPETALLRKSWASVGRISKVTFSPSAVVPEKFVLSAGAADCAVGVVAVAVVVLMVGEGSGVGVDVVLMVVWVGL